MKKTITIITLALLVVTSIFAQTVTPATAGTTTVNSNNTTQTTVELTLAKTPTYIFGIRASEFTKDNITTTDVSSTEIVNEPKITLNRYTSSDTGKNVLDVKPVSSYYLSYLFYEYDAVTLTMSLSGNLTTDQNDKDAADNSDENQIPYTVTVASTAEKDQDDNTTKTHAAATLDSSDSSARTWTNTGYTATNKLGQYVWSSLKLTIAPKYSTENTSNNAPTLKGKIKGTYKSTITLTVTVA